MSSVTAAPAYAGIPLTHRSLAAGFHVVTGHECLQSTGTPWGALAESSQTVVILMGMANLREIADRLVHFGRRGDTPVAVVRLGTTPEQQTVVGTLESIADIVAQSGIEPPAVIVVGDVVRMHDQLDWFDPKAMSRDERVAASGATSL
ncbi:hypothetical protein GCM10025859_38800 [Alicyclobacillus fastidiosus]|nr:hypothetical protein GCM10025859_38800 [Alicyclobacillus fastidiosus]